MMSIEGNADLRQLAQKHRIMILDVGYCASDWIIIDGLKVRTDFSGSVTASYSQVLNGAATKPDNTIAHENLKRKYTFKTDDIESAAFEGATSILGFGGKHYDIIELLDKNSKKVLFSALNELSSSV